MENILVCDICGGNEIKIIDRDHNIDKCNRCGYIFDNPRPTVDEIISFYAKEDKYDNWLSEEKGRDLLWQKRLKKIRILKSSGKLLDIGTGIGQFLHFAQKYYTVSGSEVSESAIKIAKTKYNLDIIKGQAETIDFQDEKFDIITLFHVLEHVPSPTRLVEKCRSILNDDGIIVVAVPNDIHSCTGRLAKRILSILKVGTFKRYGKYALPKIVLDGSLEEIHLSHFTSGTLRKLLTSRNFRIIEDGLDPFFGAFGIKRMVHSLVYYSLFLIRKIFRVNLYDAIWISASKK